MEESNGKEDFDSSQRGDAISLGLWRGIPHGASKEACSTAQGVEVVPVVKR